MRNFRGICLWGAAVGVAVLAQGFSCEGPQGPQGPAGPLLTGEVTGYCTLYDADRHSIEDCSGVIVSVEGKQISTATTADGHYTLSQVPTGVHTLTFSKDGFGMWKAPGFQFAGGGTVYGPYGRLYELPAYTVTNLASTTSSGNINITGELSGTLPSGTRYAVIFCDTTASVSHSPDHYIFTTSDYIPNTSTTVLLIIDSYYWEESGITSGDTLYCVAYAATSTYSYRDLSTLKYVFPFINETPSNVISALVP
jgi:hypothetical protein